MKSISGTSERPWPGTDLAEMGPDCYSLHTANGEARFVNGNATAVFGRQADTLVAGAFLAMMHVQDRVAAARAISDCLAMSRETSAQFRVQLAGCANGTVRVRCYEMRCVPARNGEGAMTAEDGQPLALVVTRDISDRFQMEEDLRQAREKAESLHIAKSRFLASMSHELRTPLNAILGFSELLQSDVMGQMPPDRHKEYVGLIHSSATHLLNVLNDILDMSKIEAGKYEIVPEPFKLANVLETCCAMMRGQAATRNIDLICGDFSNIPEITADERAIKQVMINLLSNAVKFTQDGGRVTLTADRTGRNVRIRVADNGIGISPEHMESLGVPFYQADSKYDRKYEGTGLGLSMVCGLVDLHGGKVEFDSEKNAGTTVTVTLPINARQSRPVPANEKIEVVRISRAAKPGNGDFSITRRAI